MKYLKILLLFFAAAVTACAQQSSLQEFAPNLFEEGMHFRISFHPSGEMLVMDRAMGEDNIVLLLARLQDDGQWAEPQLLSFSGTYPDIDPAFSPDGSRIIFSSKRPKPGTEEASTDWDLWMVSRQDDDSWSEPEYLSINTDAEELYATLDSSGTLIFTSSREGQEEPDLYESVWRDGTYSEPVRLGENINTEAVENHPNLSADGTLLFFYSRRPGGFGNADLYLSEKRNGSWSSARNLGAPVNTELLEASGQLWGDHFYFFRVEDGKDKVFAVPKDVVLEDRQN